MVSGYGRSDESSQNRRDWSGVWSNDIAEEIEQVSTEDAVAMALRLAREEGLSAGTSTGGNVVAALRAGQTVADWRDHCHGDVRYGDEISQDL